MYNSAQRKIYKKVEVYKLQSGAYVLDTTLSANDIVSIQIEEATAENNLTIGSACSSSMTLVCKTTTALTNKKLVPYLSLDGATWTKMGEYYPAELSDKTLKTWKCYDRMAYLTDDWDPGNMTFPASCSTVMTALASTYGLTITGADYPSGTPITSIECTVRELIGYIAGLQGKNAFFNHSGELQFSWYSTANQLYGDVTQDGVINSADVTYIHNNLLGTATTTAHSSVLGSMITGQSKLGLGYNSLSGIADVNEDGEVDSTDEQYVQNYIDGTTPTGKTGELYGNNTSLDPDTYIAFTKGEINHIEMLISGTSDATVETGSGNSISFYNPFVTTTSQLAGILTNIKNTATGYQYMVGEIAYKGDPAFTLGSVVSLTVSGTTYSVPIMKQSYSISGGMTAKIYSYGLSDNSTKISQNPTEKQIDRQVGDKIELLEGITETIIDANGVNGGTIEFLTNADGTRYGMTIWSTAKDKGWYWTYGGLGFFTGTTPALTNIGISNDGKVYATDVRANSIISEAFTCEDLTITGGSIAITTSSSSQDYITLNYASVYETTMAPDGLRVKMYSDYTDIDYNGINIAQSGYSSCSIRATQGNMYIAVGSGNEIYIGGTSWATTLSTLNSKWTYSATPTFTGVIASSYLQSEGYIQVNGMGTARSSSAYPYAIRCLYSTGGTFMTYLVGGSARKLKHDIKPISEELDPKKLYDAEVVQFKYNTDYLSNENDWRYNTDLPGLIADDLLEIYPKAVETDENGEAATWDPFFLVPPMLKLIQDQHAEIEALKERIEAIENEGTTGEN